MTKKTNLDKSYPKRFTLTFEPETLESPIKGTKDWDFSLVSNKN